MNRANGASDDGTIARRWLFAREQALYNARAVLLEQRDKLTEAVRGLQAEIDAIDERRSPALLLLEEMTEAEAGGRQATARPARRRRMRVRTRPPGEVVVYPPPGEEVLAALRAAGDDGLTARQFATIADIPLGTASSRLSIAKHFGRARHDRGSSRYIVLHSAPDNTNQGPTIDMI